MTFENLNLIEPILKALKLEGYTTPTPIQSQAIPIVLSKKDLLGIAQTGTGKTAAFSIPIIQMLHLDEKSVNFKNRKIRALIITPTRELAIQVYDSIKAYSKYTNLRSAVLIGGVNQYSQVKELERGVDILISTPGRLIDLINQEYADIFNVEYFVIDEADRMLDMGFIHDVKMIVSELPSQKQTLFFSATMPDEIVKLSSSILKNPEKVEIEPKVKTAEKVSQSLYFVDKVNKKSLLLDILKEINTDRILIFTRTKHGANNLVQFLEKNGIQSQAIHSDKSQNARQTALNNFKSKVTKVLIATDIASRGIDIDDLNLVINFDIPNIAETYVHRIGRTGRAGASGHSISFCSAEEKNDLEEIEHLIGASIPEVKNPKYVFKGEIATKSPNGKIDRRHSKKSKSNNQNTSKNNNSKSNNNKSNNSKSDNSKSKSILNNKPTNSKLSSKPNKQNITSQRRTR